MLKSRLMIFLLALMMALGGLALAGCDQGPAEEAGESIDDTVDDARDEIEDTFDR